MGKQVYITLDLDVFDPSILPGTGTPEPGGMLWYTMLTYLRKVFAQKEVLGFDLVELAPVPDLPASEFLVSKLYYKMLSYKFQDDDADDIYDNMFEIQEKKNTNLKFEDHEY